MQLDRILEDSTSHARSLVFRFSNANCRQRRVKKPKTRAADVGLKYYSSVWLRQLPAEVRHPQKKGVTNLPVSHAHQRDHVASIFMLQQSGEKTRVRVTRSGCPGGHFAAAFCGGISISRVALLTRSLGKSCANA
jgi:hypothetical protein